MAKEYRIMENINLIDTQVLPDTWVSSAIRRITGANQAILYIYLDIGSAELAEVLVEFGPAPDKLCVFTAASVQYGGVVYDAVPLQFLKTDPYRVAIPIADHYMRVSVRGIGDDLTGSQISVIATLSKLLSDDGG